MIEPGAVPPLTPDALYDDTHEPEDGVAERFVDAMSRLAAAVTVVAAHSPRLGRVGLTATAVTSLSAEPPMLVVCLNRASSLARALPTTGWFSVNVLAAGQQDVAEAFAGRTGLTGEERFSTGTWSTHAHGVPVLAGSCASIVCHVANSMQQATHTVVIGSVHDVVLTQDGAAHAPLMYHRRRFVVPAATEPAGGGSTDPRP